MFFAQNQLAAGRSEFALYAGVKASRLIGGIRYTDDWAVSGYYRRGISAKFTFGVNDRAAPGTALGGLVRQSAVRGRGVTVRVEHDGAGIRKKKKTKIKNKKK